MECWTVPTIVANVGSFIATIVRRARSRAVETWPGASIPWGLTITVEVAPRAAASSFMSWTKPATVPSGLTRSAREIAMSLPEGRGRRGQRLGPGSGGGKDRTRRRDQDGKNGEDHQEAVWCCHRHAGAYGNGTEECWIRGGADRVRIVRFGVAGLKDPKDLEGSI